MFVVILIFLGLALTTGVGVFALVFINVAFAPCSESIEALPCARKCDLAKRAAALKVDPKDARSPTWGEIVNDYLATHQTSQKNAV
ncbi:MAG: hypothetical protein HQ518_06200 [Rhodopirellula sp.]|nr:hypothetical protein [Rhodopirellula sp.]